MAFTFGESVWVRFLSPLDLQGPDGTVRQYDRNYKVRGWLLSSYDPCDPSIKDIKLSLLIDSKYFRGTFPRNTVDIRKRPLEDRLPTYKISSICLYRLSLEIEWVENEEIKTLWPDLPLALPIASAPKSKPFNFNCREFLQELKHRFKRYWLFGFNSKQVPDLYDIAGKLLCEEPWVKPWAQQGEGNVPFNPDQLFTAEHHWAEMLCALHWLHATPIEVDEEAWDHFLGVLPPLAMHCSFEYEGQVRSLTYVMGEGTPLTGGFCKGGKHYLISVPATANILRRNGSTITASDLFYNR